MKRNHQSINLGTTFIIILLSLLGIWFIFEKTDSYSEPQKALFAVDQDLLLIPAYKVNGQALFFLIKDKNNFGAAFVQENLFGWKAGMLTWSPMDNKRDYEKLDNYQKHGGKLIYGLIKRREDQLIKMDEKNANLLNLAMLPSSVVEKYQLEGLYIWYFKTDAPRQGGEIKLINKSTNEQIDSIDFN